MSAAASRRVGTTCWPGSCGKALGGLARCGGRQQANETFVSGLWNLGRQNWARHIRYSEGEGRSYHRYLAWLDALLLKPQALLLFLDAEAAAFALAQRRQRGLMGLTCVLEVPMEDLPQMQWREAYLAAHERNQRSLPGDTQPEVVHPEYTLVVNSKPELLACAALWNPFSSHMFAWVDAGAGRKQGFPGGEVPLSLPACRPWALCVGRRMWLFFDFRSKLLRLKHGSTFDTTVLVGGTEGVLLYALWFQWAVARYLAEGVMDDEQSIIAEVWWRGELDIQGFYGMNWGETLAQMLNAGDAESLLGEEAAASIGLARSMGRWWGAHPSLVLANDGDMWVPYIDNLNVVKRTPVNKVTDEELERVAYALWCNHRQFGYYQQFCEAYSASVPPEGLPVAAAAPRVEGLPVVWHGQGVPT